MIQPIILALFNDRGYENTRSLDSWLRALSLELRVGIRLLQAPSSEL